MIEVETREIPAMRFVGVRRRVAADASAIGGACGEILPATGRWLGARGVAPVGAPATLYHEHDEAAGTFDLQPGFFVAPDALGPEADLTGVDLPDEELEVVDVPAGEAAVAVHRGPYARLGESWSALADWVGASGRESRGPSWESYVDDPGDTDPDALRTELFRPLA